MEDIEKNKQIAQQFILNVYSDQNFENLDSIIHPNYHLDSRGELNSLEDQLWGDLNHHETGIEALIERMEIMFSFFSDVSIELLDIVAEENRVMMRYFKEFTFSGPYMGFPPTGKRIKIKGMSNMLFADGKIISADIMLDNFKFLVEAGISTMVEENQSKVNRYLDNLKRLKIIPE
ncbi:MAG: ester cyclase [Candidatus Heimdallarchaeota archaeon]|nr:ester cyclase [Candidatus Heimdallarchaeota archaeon]